MKEFALALWAMTSSHSEWQKPPEVPAAVVAASPSPRPELSAEERAQLRKALERVAKCSTGGLIYSSALEFYIPEQKPECR